jgi:hypothetical protein
MKFLKVRPVVFLSPRTLSGHWWPFDPEFAAPRRQYLGVVVPARGNSELDHAENLAG